ncbi:hypothetical protein YH65_08470 [Sulfurovum lithotrophicum]|uniref:Aminoglycoside phosphotransferase domain-containing protein n=1 Tax=Sulfurovum lithotrophicum TaxID=206403 RepID=A0A7U4M200_9BACT|nr:choline/ethanolamine kinase family protein [Sulfurovum lithotrophicum]AKF25413.1 hypothetical protein YH65_08470 [Sulfurovum lithotrophicum]
MIARLKKHLFFKNKTIDSCTLLENQGYCNENYLVVANGVKYIVRKLLQEDIDRDFEWKVQNVTYKQGIAAEPLVFDKANGFMVFAFLEGEHKRKLDKNDVQCLAETLKKLHSISIDAKPIELQIKNKTDEVQKAFKTIENYPKEYVLCHNDLNPQNIFFPNDVKFIDFEYASVNDRYFDLACVCVEFGLNQADEAYMLVSYFGKIEWEKEKLKAYKVIYKALCKQWFYTC